jgi:hypothetical protein
MPLNTPGVPPQVFTRFIFEGFSGLIGIQEITIRYKAPSPPKDANGVHAPTGYASGGPVDPKLGGP